MTARQAELLAFVVAFVRDYERSPTQREIAAGLRITQSYVFKIIERLVELGHLRRIKGRYLSLEIIHQKCPYCGESLERTDPVF